MADVDLLREAAALMRARAEKATPGHYGYVSKVTGPVSFVTRITSSDNVIAEKRDAGQGIHDLNHLSYWSPPVALAVAKAIDDVAQAWEIADGWARDLDDDLIPFEDTVDGGWLAVARAYLGRDS